MKFLVFIILLFSYTYSTPCALRKYPEGYVCVCNSTYCDFLEESLYLPKDNNVIVVTTSEDGLRFHVTDFLLNNNQTNYIVDGPKTPVDYRDDNENDDDSVTPSNFDMIMPIIQTVDKFVANVLDDDKDNDYGDHKVSIFIDPNIKYQRIIGFGGGYTGAVTHHLNIISDELKDIFFKSYFSKSDGIGFTMIRIPIGGCDYDFEPWAYNEFPLDDKLLTNFTKLDYRDEMRIKQINHLMKTVNNYNIKIMGVAWSPPRWMKNKYIWHSVSVLKPEYYQTLADYHLKYLELMHKNNITYYSISAGNEPWFGLTGHIKFMNMAWIPANLAKYIAENLGPTIRNSSFNNIKIFVGEDQRLIYPWYFLQMRDAYPKVFDYVDGFTAHFYTDLFTPPELLEETLKTFNKKIMIITESSEPRPNDPSERYFPVLGNWQRGEHLFKAILKNFQNVITGWLDWNLLLDETGTPNYSNYTLDANIVLNATTHKELYKQPTFFSIGHFSKFITPDSVRIDAIRFQSTTDINQVAFLRPDNIIVVVFYNPTLYTVDVTLRGNKANRIQLNVPPKSMNTVLYKNH